RAARRARGADRAGVDRPGPAGAFGLPGRGGPPPRLPAGRPAILIPPENVPPSLASHHRARAALLRRLEAVAHHGGAGGQAQRPPDELGPDPVPNRGPSEPCVVAAR